MTLEDASGILLVAALFVLGVSSVGYLVFQWGLRSALDCVDPAEVTKWLPNYYPIKRLEPTAWLAFFISRPYKLVIHSHPSLYRRCAWMRRFYFAVIASVFLVGIALAGFRYAQVHGG